jgi:hypothetical protein
MTTRGLVLHSIVGCARRGSTLLDSILGSAPGMVATGELNALLWEELDGPRRCACGDVLEECVFWGPVLRRWSASLSPARPADYLRLQSRFERVRTLPRLLRMSSHPTPEFETYATWTASLLAAIAEAGSVEHVADSSKNPFRAWALLESGKIAMTLVHLVRDPRGIAWSKVKRLRRTDLPAWIQKPGAIVLRSALDWFLINRMAERVARRYPGTSYIRLRYEDLADRPAEALHDAGSRIGVDLDGLGRRIETGEPFSFSHIMAGNLARLEPPRRVTKDTEWMTKSPAWVRGLVWAICGHLARRYGYLS